VGEALVRDALSITANVVDPAGERQRSEECEPRVGDVERGAVVGHRRIFAAARAIKQPHTEDDSASTGAREAVGLLFRNERRAEERSDLADGCLL
jgi:hypothetical protein